MVKKFIRIVKDQNAGDVLQLFISIHWVRIWRIQACWPVRDFAMKKVHITKEKIVCALS